jgi:hypothetical protein
MRSQLEQLLLAISSNAFLQGERTILIFDRYGLIRAFVRGPDRFREFVRLIIPSLKYGRLFALFGVFASRVAAVLLAKRLEEGE